LSIIPLLQTIEQTWSWNGKEQPAQQATHMNGPQQEGNILKLEQHRK